MRVRIGLGLLLAVIIGALSISYMLISPERIMESFSWKFRGLQSVQFLDGSIVVGNIVWGKYQFVGRSKIIFHRPGRGTAHFEPGGLISSPELRVEPDAQMLLTVKFGRGYRTMTWYIDRGESLFPYLQFSRYDKTGSQNTGDELKARMTPTQIVGLSPSEKPAWPSPSPLPNRAATPQPLQEAQLKPESIRAEFSSISTPVPEFLEMQTGGWESPRHGLMWTDPKRGEVNLGRLSNSGFLWEQSSAICEDERFNGFDGWRLPTARELVEFGPPASGWFWTATVVEDDPRLAYVGRNGRVIRQHKAQSASVICVRRMGD